MIHNTSQLRSVLSFTLAVSALSVLLPSRAEAQVRLSALAGVAHLGSRNAGVPSAVATGRIEGTFGLVPWLHVGGYFGLQSDLSGPSGGSYGAIAALRPRIPLFPLSPFAFASVGWMNYPTGPSSLGGVVDGQAGVGLAIEAGSMLDVEARVAYVGILSRGDDASALGGSGYAFSAGLALHF